MGHVKSKLVVSPFTLTAFVPGLLDVYKDLPGIEVNSGGGGYAKLMTSVIRSR